MNFADQLISAYHNEANHSLARVCRGVACLMILIYILSIFHVFVIQLDWMNSVIFFSVLISMLPTLLFDFLKIKKKWAEYFVLTTIVFMCGAMYAVLSYHSIIMLAFPLVCACLYSERRIIIYTMGILIPVIIISHLVAFQLKVVPDEPLITMKGVIFYGILPRIIQIVAIGIICITIVNRLKDLIQTLILKNNELYENQQTLIASLSELIETQSQETGQHVKRVKEYTRILCEGLHYSSEETWKVSIASMMHDVGKLLVPTEILEKPGRLSDEEFEIVKKHVDYGRQMLEKSPGEVMRISTIIAYQHHERWDGTGYHHLQGEEINPYARCVAIADVFDALVSSRSYKKAWTAQEAYDEICRQSGKQFDPQMVEVFKKSFTQFMKVVEDYPDSRNLSIDEIVQ